MTARRKLTTLDRLKIVVEQARCPLCKERLGELDDLEFDHIHALARGGTDTLDNLRAVHRTCHAVKTRGAGATTLRSDQGEMRKDRQLARKREAQKAPREIETPAKRLKPKAKIKARVRPAPKPQNRATGHVRRGV